MSEGVAVRRRSTRKVALVILGIAAVALLGALLAVHRLLYSVDIRVSGDPVLDWDPEIGVVSRRSSDTAFEHPIAFHVHTDRRGARVARRGEETPARVDLVTLGCSFAWGFGVEAEAAFTELLRARLHVDAATLAFPGHGTVQSVLLLERHRDLSPRVIVYAFIDDHLRRNLSPCAPFGLTGCMATAFVADGAGGPHIAPLRADRGAFETNVAVVEDIFERRAAAFPGDAFHIVKGRLEASLGMVAAAAADTPELRESAMRYLLARMADDARAMGAALVVVRIPPLARRERAPAQRILEAALPAGVTYVDLAAAVHEYNADTSLPPLDLARNDAHPSAVGQAFIAERIAPVVSAALAGSLGAAPR